MKLLLFYLSPALYLAGAFVSVMRLRTADDNLHPAQTAARVRKSVIYKTVLFAACALVLAFNKEFSGFGFVPMMLAGLVLWIEIFAETKN